MNAYSQKNHSGGNIAHSIYSATLTHGTWAACWLPPAATAMLPDSDGSAIVPKHQVQPYMIVNRLTTISAMLITPSILPRGDLQTDRIAEVAVSRNRRLSSRPPRTALAPSTVMPLDGKVPGANARKIRAFSASRWLLEARNSDLTNATPKLARTSAACMSTDSCESRIVSDPISGPLGKSLALYLLAMSTRSSAALVRRATSVPAHVVGEPDGVSSSAFSLSSSTSARSLGSACTELSTRATATRAPAFSLANWRFPVPSASRTFATNSPAKSS